MLKLVAIVGISKGLVHVNIVWLWGENVEEHLEVVMIMITERERERAKIQQSNKPNKSPQEQTELEQLKNKLKDLEQKNKNATTQPTKDSKFNPFYVIIPVGLVVVCVIILFKNSKKTKKEFSNKGFG